MSAPLAKWLADKQAQTKIPAATRMGYLSAEKFIGAKRAKEDPSLNPWGVLCDLFEQAGYGGGWRSTTVYMPIADTKDSWRLRVFTVGDEAALTHPPRIVLDYFGLDITYYQRNRGATLAEILTEILRRYDTTQKENEAHEDHEDGVPEA